jgi:hypothetical protein
LLAGPTVTRAPCCEEFVESMKTQLASIRYNIFLDCNIVTEELCNYIIMALIQFILAINYDF